MRNFFKKYFWEAIGGIIGVVGIFATITSAIATGNENFFIVYVLALALESVLALIAIWHIVIKHSYERKIDSLVSEVSEKNVEIQNLQVERSDAKINENKKSAKAVAIIISNLKNASKLSNDLCNRIPKTTASSFATLEALQQGGVADEELLKKEMICAYDDYANALYDLYKRYTSNLLSYVLNMIGAQLSIEDITNKISASVKLFDRPLNSNDNRNQVRVYTAFRDKQTYEEHEREIGEELYTIAGNIDFGCCLQKDQYIVNNITKEAENYLNEHIDFDKYYNCAVVVPIRVKQVNSTYDYLGYICCDCLNNNENDVFKKESAQLLFSMAQLYAMFLETLNSNWYERTHEPTSFLRVIYRKTYTGKNR